MHKIIMFLLTSSLLLTACGGAPATPKQWSSPPPMQIDMTKTYYATISTTLGSFKIQLFPSEAPNTVNNFVFLANQGFYKGIIFHRIIKNFMIQTGDPTGMGTGGPGYRFNDELPAKHAYDVGVVAMANAGPNTNGSQFFVCTGSDAAFLNMQPNYTQFGKVVSGMEVVQAIGVVPTGPGDRPRDPPSITKITISNK